MTMEIDLSAFSEEELIDPVVEPIEPIDPVDPPVDPVEPVEPGEPTEPIEPVEPAEPSDDDSKNVKLVYSKVAKLLKEQGFFDDELDLEKVESSDSLVEALRGEIKKNELSDLSDTQKSYLNAVRDGVPDTMFAQHQQTVANYDSITESMVAENDELRKNIIMTDLTTKGISDKRAQALYSTLAESGEDVTEALTSLKSLKASETERYQAEVDKIKSANVEVENEEKNRFKKLKASVYETQEIIKDYKITDKLRDSVYKSMTKGVAYGEDGRPISKFTNERDKDPVGFDTKLYYLFEMTKGFKDFSVFEKKARSKASAELERVVRESNVMSLTGKPSVQDVNEKDIPQIIELSEN